MSSRAEAGGGQEFQVSSCHNEAEHDRCRAFAEVTGPRVVVQSRWCPICVWIIFDLIIFITHMFRCTQTRWLNTTTLCGKSYVLQNNLPLTWRHDFCLLDIIFIYIHIHTYMHALLRILSFKAFSARRCSNAWAKSVLISVTLIGCLRRMMEVLKGSVAFCFITNQIVWMNLQKLLSKTSRTSKTTQSSFSLSVWLKKPFQRWPPCTCNALK